MNIYGYEKDNENDKLLELQDVTVKCDMTELNKLIEFLLYVKESHSKIEVGLCHSHFRDWNNEWHSGMADIIVVTESK